MLPGVATAGMAIPTTATRATFMSPATSSTSHTTSTRATSIAGSTRAGGTTATTTDGQLCGLNVAGPTATPVSREPGVGPMQSLPLPAEILAGVPGSFLRLRGPLGRRRWQGVETTSHRQYHTGQKASNHEQRDRSVHQAHQGGNKSGAAPAYRPEPQRVAERRN